MAVSDGFESYRDSNIFKKANSWSVTRLWVVFFKRRKMVTNLPPQFYELGRVVRTISPGREGISWQPDSLILSYQLGVPYYPERCPKKETFLVKAPLFEPLSNFAASCVVKRKTSQI